MLLPRNSNSWQGFLQIGDRSKPADAGTLQFALSFWLRQHLAAQTYRRQCKSKSMIQREAEAMQHTDEIPSLVPWGCSWKATISVGCPLEIPPSTGPDEKCFRVPETKMKLQHYGDTSVLTVAKYAISLKQWGGGGWGGGRNVLWFIYLFPVAVENFLSAKREAWNWPHLPIMNQH